MKMKKRFLSILLSLVMVLVLMPGMSMTALADDPVANGESIEPEAPKTFVKVSSADAL